MHQSLKPSWTPFHSRSAALKRPQTGTAWRTRICGRVRISRTQLFAPGCTGFARRADAPEGKPSFGARHRRGIVIHIGQNKPWGCSRAAIIGKHFRGFSSIRGTLLMTDDGMRHIRLFQVCDLFLGQFNGQSADGIFQMRDLRCPDDGRRHRLLL